MSYCITQNFALGLDYRLLFAEDVELFGVDAESSYGQFALTLSFGF